MALDDATARLVTEALPPLLGCPGVAQGAYGDAGNLELVVPDPADGFWCFWWNADLTETHAGAAVGAWSGGLHVSGPRLDAVHVTQVQAGPKFLEVVGAGDGMLHRWYWTPTDGFVRAESPAASAIASSAVVEDERGALHLLTVRADGAITHLTAGPEGYPAVTWQSAVVDELPAVSVDLVRDPAGLVALLLAVDGSAQCLRYKDFWIDEPGPPGHWAALSLTGGGTPAAIGTDLSGVVQASFRERDGWTEPAPVTDVTGVDHVSAAATTVGGGRLDVVAAGSGELWHLTSSPSWSYQKIVSKVWCTGDPDTVHRH